MLEFPKMKTDKGFITSETVVTSKTLSKEMHPKWNRKQRRDVIFANPVKHLMDKVSILRRDMVVAGLEPVPFPKCAMSRKVLSGHMSQLVTQATA